MSAWSAAARRQSSHRRNDLLKQPTRFPDLSAAGRALSPQLAEYKNDPNAIVLGIALGGVPVAREVANFLEKPLDLILIRRLLVGDQAGSDICAVNIAGIRIIDDQISLPAIPRTPQEHFLIEAIAAFEQRAQLCRRGRSAVEFTDRTLIVVDCGIRTGSTMKAAARALSKIKARRIVAAVPVSSPEGQAEVAPLFDEFVCLLQPENFVNAGYWYADFRRPGDDQVGDLLE
jgi:putative phosphoribosyl transferase